MEKAIPKLKKAVELAVSVTPDLEELLKVQAKVLWSYYGQLKKEGFTDEQAFELVKYAAPKQLEIKMKRKQ